MSGQQAISAACCVLSALVAASACSQSSSTPPAPAPPGAATFVSASFDLTWNAAFDHFTASGIPLATVDPDSGEIETERLAVGPMEAVEFADCGSTGGPDPDPYVASSVVYDVLVRDEGLSSTVRVTASWETADARAPFRCETTGVQEGEMQEAIKLAAEVNR